MGSLKDRGTWDLVFPEKGDKVLLGKWVLDVKYKRNGEWIRNRAKWVVYGNFEDISYWEVQESYAAVASSAIVRLFFYIVTIFDFDCEQYDIVTAFLNAKIPKGTRILVQQLTGFDDGSGRACLLNNAFYGLSRAPL